MYATNSTEHKEFLSQPFSGPYRLALALNMCPVKPHKNLKMLLNLNRHNMDLNQPSLELNRYFMDRNRFSC